MTRLTTGRKKRTAGIYPPPVYVAQFADGEIGRMSFHSPVGKPIDFDYGRRVVAAAWGHPLPQLMEVTSEERCWCVDFKTGAPLVKECHTCHGTRKQTVTQQVLQGADGQPWRFDVVYPAREDLVAGHVEHDGQVIPDPRFNGNGTSANDSGESNVPARPDPVANILRAVGKLSAEDRARLVAALVC